MSSVLRSVRKRKKSRTLGPVEIIRREDYAELEVDAKVELIRSLVPLGLMHIEELLDEEVTALAGERYARKDPSVGGRRHGSNPGTVGLAGQRVPIRVPRIRHVTGSEMPLRSYEALHGERAVNDLLLTRVLYGISCRNYEAAAEAIPGAIGLSGSTVSRTFIQASATKLRELQERDLSGEDVVAMVLDGKTFAESTMVVARCFRHQVLLRCDRHVHDSGSGRPVRVSEHPHVTQPHDNAPQGHEDVPQGQSPRGEPRLHRRRPRLAAEPQRPMRSHEVVVATQQLEMRVKRVGRACMGQRPS